MSQRRILASTTLASATMVAALVAVLLAATGVRAEMPEVQLHLRNHLFDPAELIIPAHTKVRIRIHNHDSTPEGFESLQLNRKKILLGEQSTVIFVGPLGPGEYIFHGEFHPKTAQGKLLVQ